MKIGLDQRVAIIGKTGSGKSFLAKRLHSNTKRLVVFDPKNELKSSWGLTSWDRGIKKLRKGEYVRLHVPSLKGSSKDIADLYDDYFEEILDIGNVVVYIDEINAITGGSYVIRSNLNMLFTMGRGLGISVRVCTQRPANVPPVLLSEADYYFVFRLQNRDDRKRVGNLIGMSEVPLIKDRHGFYLVETLDDKLYYVDKLKTK